MTTTPHNPTSSAKLGHTAERIAKLAELFPGCISTTTDELGSQRQTVNLQHIREQLAGFVADEAPERYHLDWPGKRDAIVAGLPTSATSSDDAPSNAPRSKASTSIRLATTSSSRATTSTRSSS